MYNHPNWKPVHMTRFQLNREKINMVAKSKSATADKTKQGPRSATRATGQRRHLTPFNEGRSLGIDWFKSQEPDGRTTWSPNYVDNEVKRGEKTLDLEPAKPEVELTDGKHTNEHGQGVQEQQEAMYNNFLSTVKKTPPIKQESTVKANRTDQELTKALYDRMVKVEPRRRPDPNNADLFTSPLARSGYDEIPMGTYATPEPFSPRTTARLASPYRRAVATEERRLEIKKAEKKFRKTKSKNGHRKGDSMEESWLPSNFSSSSSTGTPASMISPQRTTGNQEKHRLRRRKLDSPGSSSEDTVPISQEDNWPTISPVHFKDSSPEIINGWDLRDLETAMRASKEETEKCPSIVNGWDQREMEAALKASLEENKKLSKRLEEVESKMTRPNFHSRHGRVGGKGGMPEKQHKPDDKRGVKKMGHDPDVCYYSDNPYSDEGDEGDDEGEYEEDGMDNSDTLEETPVKEKKRVTFNLKGTHEDVKELTDEEKKRLVEEVRYQKALNEKKALMRPDTKRMADLANTYVRRHGKMSTSEDFANKFKPWLKRMMNSQGLDVKLIDLKTQAWNPEIEESPQITKERRELYSLIEGVIDQKVLGTAVLGTVKEQETADGQAVFKRLHDTLHFGIKHGDTLDLDKKAATCTMRSTGKNVEDYAIQLLAYETALKDVGVHQNHQKVLIPRYLKGLSDPFGQIVERLKVNMEMKPKKFDTLQKVSAFVNKQAAKEGLTSVTVQPKNKFQGNSNKKKDKDSDPNAELKKLKHQLAMVTANGKKDCKYGGGCKNDNCTFRHPAKGKGEGKESYKDRYAKCKKCGHHHKEGVCGKCWNCGGDHSRKECPEKKEQNSAKVETGEEKKSDSQKDATPAKGTNQEAAQRALKEAFAGAAIKESVVDGVKTITITTQNAVEVHREVKSNHDKEVLVVIDRDPDWFEKLLLRDAISTLEPEWVYAMPQGHFGPLYYHLDNEARKAWRPSGNSLGEDGHHCGDSQKSKKQQNKRQHKKRERKLSKGCKGKTKQKRKVNMKANSVPKQCKSSRPRYQKVKKDRMRRTKARKRCRRSPLKRLLTNMKWWNASKTSLPGNKGYKKKFQKKAMEVVDSRKKWFIDRQEVKQMDKMINNLRWLIYSAAQKSNRARRQWVNFSVWRTHNKWTRNFDVVMRDVKILGVLKQRCQGEDMGVIMVAAPATVSVKSQNVGTKKRKGVRDVLLDSGAQVMSVDGAETTLTKIGPMSSPTCVSGVNGDMVPVTKQGVWSLKTANGHHMKFPKTLDLRGSSYDLLSVGILDDAGLEVRFAGGRGVVTNPADGEVLLVAPKEDGLYRLKASHSIQNFYQAPQHVVNWTVSTLLSAHEMLRHLDFDVVRKLLNLPPASRTNPNPVCESCQYARMREKKSAKEALTAAPRYGYRLHSDMSRKMPITNAFGVQDIQRYQLTGDEFTGTLWVNFCQRKSDGGKLVLKVVDAINNERAPERVVEHQTDGGKEYVQKKLEAELVKRGVTTRNSAPHCQYQNGWIEQRMGEIDRGSRAMLFRGNAPESDYPFALQHWIWLHDILPHPITGLSPYEKRTGVSPDVKPENIQCKLFCLCYAKLYVHGSLERAAQKCIFLGKDNKTPGSLVRRIGGKRRGQTVMSAQVVSFDIDTFPYTDLQVPKPVARGALHFASDSDGSDDSDFENVDADGITSFKCMTKKMVVNLTVLMRMWT